MQILRRNMVAMNRWGGEEKGNLITSLAAVGSLACGNNASGTKGSLCSASGRQRARNAVAVMVTQVFSGSFDICQVPVVQCRSGQERPAQVILRTCSMEQTVPWPSLVPAENGSVERGERGPAGAVWAQHTCSGSVCLPVQNQPVLSERLGEPHRVLS